MAFHIIPMCRPGRWFLGSRLGTVVWPGGWPGAWGDIWWAGPDGDWGWRVWGDTGWWKRLYGIDGRTFFSSLNLLPQCLVFFPWEFNLVQDFFKYSNTEFFIPMQRHNSSSSVRMDIPCMASNLMNFLKTGFVNYFPHLPSEQIKKSLKSLLKRVILNIEMRWLVALIRWL